MIPMCRRALVIVALAVVSGLPLPAQQPPSPAQQPAPPAPPPRPASSPRDQQPSVTFRVEVNYVEIDAVVTDAQGNFVRNLSKDDFEIVEEGKPQDLSVLSLVDIPIERTDAPLFSPKAIEPDVRSNTKEFNGRVFVLVLDDLQTHFARSVRVRAAAKLFIERYLGANDIAAIVETGSRKDGAQEFTSSRPLLLKAVNNFAGQKIRSATLDKLDDYYMQREVNPGAAPRDLSEAERAFKARNTLATLRQVADYLAGVRGRRKAVVYFSEGIDYDMGNPMQNRYASEVRDEMEAAIAAATRANVSFYGVDPRGLTDLGDEGIDITSVPNDPTLGLGMSSLSDELRRSQDSLRTISDETGGFAAVNRNDFREAFGHIIQDNSGYYLLGYYSNDTRRDGRYRRVQVRVKRPGLTVRARRGYVAPKGKAPTTTAAATNKQTSASLREALDSPIPISGLGLSVFAAPFKGTAPNASIAITLEVEGRGLTFAAQNGLFADDVEVSVLAVDRDAKIKDGGRDVVQLKLRPQTHDMVSRSGIRISRRLELPPGRYQLRVGVRDGGSGATGSVLYDLDVPDFSKDALSMSAVLLTSASASHVPSVNPDEEFKAVLPGQPSTIREFPRNDTMGLFTEVYDNQTKVAHRVAIKASVIADDGKVVFTAGDERKSEELQGAKGGYGYTTMIDTRTLAPGRYVLRVEATTLLTDGGKAMRELEFRIR
jgi:VWFA-related protein